MKLIKEIQACRVCEKSLPLRPRPVVSFSTKSKIVVIGQAPGLKVHNSGVPWDDASGERLREWLGVSASVFYDRSLFGIVPMGFCYPGRGKSGDNPPRPECADLWMERVLRSIKSTELVLLIGQYSQNYFLGDAKRETLTETVRHFKDYLPEYFALPHPSPRNNIWLKKNGWFLKEAVPSLRRRVKRILK